MIFGGFRPSGRSEDLRKAGQPSGRPLPVTQLKRARSYSPCANAAQIKGAALTLACLQACRLRLAKMIAHKLSGEPVIFGDCVALAAESRADLAFRGVILNLLEFTEDARRLSQNRATDGFRCGGAALMAAEADESGQILGGLDPSSEQSKTSKRRSPLSMMAPKPS